MECTDNCAICGTDRQPLISVYTEIAVGVPERMQTLLECMRDLTWKQTQYLKVKENPKPKNFCERCAKTLELAHYFYELCKQLIEAGPEKQENALNELVTVTVSVGLKGNENNEGHDSEANRRYCTFFGQAFDLIKYVDCSDVVAKPEAPKVAAHEEPMNFNQFDSRLDPFFTKQCDVIEYVKCGNSYVPKLSAPMVVESPLLESNQTSYSIDSAYFNHLGNSVESLTGLNDSSFASADHNMLNLSNDEHSPISCPEGVPPSPMHIDEGIDCNIYYDVLPDATTYPGSFNNNVDCHNFLDAAPTPGHAEPDSVVEFVTYDEHFAKEEVVELVADPIETKPVPYLVLNEEPIVISEDEEDVQQPNAAQHKCNLCGFRTNVFADLRAHYDKAHNDLSLELMMSPLMPKEKITFKCNKCVFSTTKLLDIRFHGYHFHGFKTKNIEMHYTTEYGCWDCPRKFKGAKCVRTHHTLVHGKSKGIRKISNNLFVCDFCGMEFRFKSGLMIHQRFCGRFNEPIKCDSCDRVQFTSMLRFEEHLRAVHGIQLDYKCEICHRSFKTREYLTRHRRRHDERHFQCQQCDRNYVNEVELKKHVNRIHRQGRPAPMPVVCSKCHCHFASAADLKRHSGTHLLKCRTCGAEFKTRHKLRSHRFTHTGKPYKCEQCNVQFVRRHMMVRHAKTVHEVDLSAEALNQMYMRNIGHPSRYYAFAPENNDLMLFDDKDAEDILAAAMQEIGIDINDVSEIC